jgi:SAM-dependent methyltransferase
MNDTQRRRRATFDANPQAYSDGRAGYPERVYQSLVEQCGLGPGSIVLEIGPGTGQATRPLLELGAAVTAVEVGPALAARLRDQLGPAGLTVVEGDFPSVAVPARGFDLAVSATAFHWLDASTAIPALARAVRPSGWLALWWTIHGDPQTITPWRIGLDALFARLLPAERRDLAEIPPAMQTQERVAEIEAGGWFGPASAELIRWERRLTPVTARALFATFSNIAELPPPERARFLDAVAELVDAQPGGAVMDRHVTAMYLAPRTDQPAPAPLPDGGAPRS